MQQAVQVNVPRYGIEGVVAMPEAANSVHQEFGVVHFYFVFRQLTLNPKP